MYEDLFVFYYVSDKQTVYIVKSILVLLFLLSIIAATIVMIVKIINRRHNTHDKTLIRKTIICSAIAIVSVIFLGTYTYPFERTLDPILIAEVNLDEEHAIAYPGDISWHGAYEKYGFYAGSAYFSYDESTRHGFSWPEMDLNNHCYIVTYGQKIDSLTYNIWDKIKYPIRTGAYSGHVQLNEEFAPQKVYIYQIPKIRIENADWQG